MWKFPLESLPRRFGAVRRQLFDLLIICWCWKRQARASGNREVWTQVTRAQVRRKGRR